MAKKDDKYKKMQDLSAQHEHAAKLGTLTPSVVVPTPPTTRVVQLAIVERTYTTYSAYEDPIAAD